MIQIKLEILIAEQDRQVADAARRWLNDAGFNAVVLNDGLEVLDYIDGHKPDLALVGMCLPGTDGLELCRYIRRRYPCPIIMITSAKDKLNRLLIPLMGINDSMVKPFKEAELLGRVREQLRIYVKCCLGLTWPETHVLKVRELVIDREKCKCSLENRSIKLTCIEFDILWQLCLTPGKAISAEELFRRVWHEQFFLTSANTVMVHMRHIRIKLRDDSNPEPYIRTVRREGYMVSP